MWNIFKNKKESVQKLPLLVDFHSHFLPGLDDGCATLEESMILISKMAEYGYTRLIMSPHIMGDYYKNTPEGIGEKLELVKNEASLRNINIALNATAEYYLDEWFDDKLKSKNLIPFGKNNLLFEISYVNEPRNLFETVFNIQVAGFQPVLAHPERYSFYHNNFEIYEKLAEQGCQLQVNLLSLIGYYGPNEKKIAEKLIEKNLVYYVSSDAHREKHVDMLKSVFATEAFAKVSHQVRNNELLNF
jgi:tyrosine-protein phosphatase YwqE